MEIQVWIDRRFAESHSTIVKLLIATEFTRVKRSFYTEYIRSRVEYALIMRKQP